MNKQKFLTDLDLALHWYLPQPEADEILADYQEMAASAEDDCPLLRENPKAIAQSLSNRGEHRRWLLFMGVLLILIITSHLLNLLWSCWLFPACCCPWAICFLSNAWAKGRPGRARPCGLACFSWPPLCF